MTGNVPSWHILGMTLDEFMRDHKMTDQALAAQIGVSRPHLSRIRNGKRRPSIDVAAKLEAATGIPAASFAEARCQ